jgi:hypothetical protein
VLAAAAARRQELRRRSEQVVRARETGEQASASYLGELGRRMHELRDQRLARIALGSFAVSSAVVLGIVAL